MAKTQNTKHAISTIVVQVCLQSYRSTTFYITEFCESHAKIYRVPDKSGRAFNDRFALQHLALTILAIIVSLIAVVKKSEQLQLCCHQKWPQVFVRSISSSSVREKPLPSRRVLYEGSTCNLVVVCLTPAIITRQSSFRNITR